MPRRLSLSNSEERIFGGDVESEVDAEQRSNERQESEAGVKVGCQYGAVVELELKRVHAREVHAPNTAASERHGRKQVQQAPHHAVDRAAPPFHELYGCSVDQSRCMTVLRTNRVMDDARVRTAETTGDRNKVGEHDPTDEPPLEDWSVGFVLHGCASLEFVLREARAQLCDSTQHFRNRASYFCIMCSFWHPNTSTTHVGKTRRYSKGPPTHLRTPNVRSYSSPEVV